MFLFSKPTKVKDLFKSEWRWTKWHSARNIFGSYCEPNSPFAICYCLGGGIRLVYNNPSDIRSARQKVKDAIKKLFEYRFSSCGNDIESFNDNQKTTIKDIREILELADV